MAPLAGPWREVIGVVADVRMNGADAAPPATVYWPAIMAEFYPGQPFFVYRAVAFAVRSPQAGSPGLTRQIEQAVWSVNASLPVAAMRTMQDIYDRSLGRTSFTLVMLVAAASAALVLGVVGLYGVLSYAVSTRRREIAIRFALGAKARDVQRRIVRQGVVLAGIGVAIGLAAAAGVTRLMTSLLYEVEAGRSTDVCGRRCGTDRSRRARELLAGAARFDRRSRGIVGGGIRCVGSAQVRTLRVQKIPRGGM